MAKKEKYREKTSNDDLLMWGFLVFLFAALGFSEDATPRDALLSSPIASHRIRFRTPHPRA
jgi:hypothetical protein